MSPIKFGLLVFSSNFKLFDLLFLSYFWVFSFFVGLPVGSLFTWFYFFWVGFVVFLSYTRLVCTVIFAGCYSNYSYSLLDGLRALAQAISYEVRLAFITWSITCHIVPISFANLTWISWERTYDSAMTDRRITTPAVAWH